jgi:hypothetical protein
MGWRYTEVKAMSLDEMDGSYPHPGGPTGTRKVYPDKAIGNCGLKTVFPKLLEARKQAREEGGRATEAEVCLFLISTSSTLQGVLLRVLQLADETAPGGTRYNEEKDEEVRSQGKRNGDRYGH